MAFDGLSARLQEITRKLSGKARISEGDLKEVLREVKLALLEADVNYKIVKDFVDSFESAEYNYNLNLSYKNTEYPNEYIENIYNDVWKNNYDVGVEENIFYMWISDNGKTIIVTKTRNATKFSRYPDIIGEFDINDGLDISVSEGIKKIGLPQKYTGELLEASTNENEFKISWNHYYKQYDATIYGYSIFTYYGSIRSFQ